MKLRFCGTGYGPCRVKKKQSKDFRRSASLLVDDALLVDPSPDLFAFADDFGLGRIFGGVRQVLVTHSHPGHFCVQTVTALAARGVTVYGSAAVLALLPETAGIVPVVLAPGVPLTLPGDYTVLPLAAPHKTENPFEVCYNFLIRRDRTVFVGMDGGGFPEPTFRAMREYPPDCVVAECALGDAEADERLYYHNSLPSLIAWRKFLIRAGAIGEQTRFILTHLPTDKKRSVHEDLFPAAAAEGMTLAYDGYFVNL